MLLTAILAAASLALFSCDKDDEKDSALKAAEEKVLGRWQIDSIAIIERRVSEVLKNTYAGTSADYVEFNSNGKMKTVFRGVLDVANYKLESDTEFIIDGSDVKILELTDKKFVFHFKDNFGVVGSSEQTHYLKR